MEGITPLATQSDALAVSQPFAEAPPATWNPIKHLELSPDCGHPTSGTQVILKREHRIPSRKSQKEEHESQHAQIASTV
ncbi:hypothetical protein J2Y48_001856 [Mycoplana sp. BE70]|uniref:hypothetical protein n=1 Tax=Mycoplana sp. BE70 TaxID=2817775 RepID=UPI0028605BB1|nr:hypothetical protein [Mycoplana sp. BE70]MDR6756563.1 hypothetical protein [Mycoplana sp. BE70]